MLSGDPWRLEVSPRCDGLRHTILACAVAGRAGRSAGSCPEVSPRPSRSAMDAEGAGMGHGECRLACMSV